MPRKGSSLYVQSNGADDANLEIGLRWLFTEAQKAGNKGLIAVSNKQVLDNIASWSKFKGLFKTLQKDGAVVQGAVTLSIFNGTQPKTQSWNGPILVIYGADDLLDAVDSITGKASVLYIPWNEGDGKAWVETWGAGILGIHSESVCPPIDQMEGVALKAMESLSSAVNLGTGIINTNDRLFAIRVLETLFHKKIVVTPEKIRQQLIRLGWMPGYAKDVKDLAAMIWEGRKPKGSTGSFDDRLWNLWNGVAE